MTNIAQISAFLVALLLPFIAVTKDQDTSKEDSQPLKWAWVEMAPVGWNYVSSKDGVDTFFRSEGKLAMDTMMLCSGLDFQFRKVAANTFCTFPNEAANIIFLGSTSSG